MTLFITALAVLGLALLGMLARVFLIKNGEFRAGCASRNPLLRQEGTACSVCGSLPGEDCKKEEESEITSLN